MAKLGVDRSVPLMPSPADAARRARNLAPTLEAPALARAFLAEACTEWRVPPATTERLQLIATELVGNVVQHARTPMQLVLRRSRRYVHVSVIDEDPRPATLRGPQTPSAEAGRGLMLVDAFAVAWGCAPTANGKSTWATVDRTAIG